MANNLKQYEYYRTENGVLYCGDCLTIMPQLEPVDLVLTSPPYDNLREYDGYKFDYKKTILSIKQILNTGGVCVWVVGDETKDGSESGNSFRHALFFIETGLNLHDTMIYEKNGVMPSINRYCQMFEYMFILSNGKPKTTNLIIDRLNNWGNTKTGNIGQRQKDGSVLKRGVKEIKEYGMRFNIWKINNEGGFMNKDVLTKEHPATFPETLANDHIISWSNKGDVVADIMCGSGTTCKISEKLDRRWIGIEISEKYCEIAAKRIEAERKQLKLF